MKLNAECGMRSSRETTSRTAPLVSRCSPRAVRHVVSRLGVTLIELLIAIAIMATLSVMFLGASRAAMEHSRGSRTKMTISKLHTLLMEQWASYETRRVDLNQSLQNELNALPSNTVAQIKAKSLAGHDARLNAVRELMKLEMPDHWSDVTGVSEGNAPTTDPAFLQAVKDLPTLAKVYRRRYENGTYPTVAFEGAECLYLIIMYACGDGEARTMFSAQDIGDVDEDGAPEFLDGWGRPIGFIRWPAGFTTVSSVMSGDFESDHDPFDPFGRDQPHPPSEVSTLYSWFNDDYGAYRLVPLIYSLGADEEGGLIFFDTGGSNLDPYEPDSNGYLNGSPELVGGKLTSDHIDNIHNHLQEGR